MEDLFSGLSATLVFASWGLLYGIPLVGRYSRLLGVRKQLFADL
jgi:hypothetical protein